MTAVLTLEGLGPHVEQGDIDTVIAAAVDRDGGLVGRRFQARHFLDVAHRETHPCAPSYDSDRDNPSGAIGAGMADYVMRPDLSTLRRAAWLPATALVMCNVLHRQGHAPVHHSPRQMLIHQIARAEALGYEVRAASALDFTILDQSYDELRQFGGRDLCPGGAWAASGARDCEPVMRRIRNDLAASGLPVEGSAERTGRGQVALALRFGPALAAADHHAIAKTAAKEIGRQMGQEVSFLSKWPGPNIGSSSSIHLSLWNGTSPVFHDETRDQSMSSIMRCFMGGVIKGLDEITYFMAPTINSYKRLRDSAAPTRKVWTVNNRLAALRLSGAGTRSIRIECRVPGADANPYLALAALIAAGLDGVSQRLDCGPESKGDGPGGQAAHVPLSLREAVLALGGSAMLRKAMGEAVIDHYLHAAEQEQRAFDTAVTDWEIARGLERA